MTAVHVDSYIRAARFFIPPPCGEGGQPKAGRVGVNHNGNLRTWTRAPASVTLLEPGRSGEVTVSTEHARALRKRLTPQEVKL